MSDLLDAIASLLLILVRKFLQKELDLPPPTLDILSTILTEIQEFFNGQTDEQIKK